MGNSRAVMLGAISLIIGMYALKIKEADRVVVEIGNSRGEELQALELARTGMNLAVNELSATEHGIGWRTRQRSALGGTVTYTIDNVAYGQERVTVTATIGDSTRAQTRTLVALLEKSNGGSQRVGRRTKTWSRWEVSKIYVKPHKKNWHSQGNSPI